MSNQSLNRTPTPEMFFIFGTGHSIDLRFRFEDDCEAYDVARSYQVRVLSSYLILCLNFSLSSLSDFGFGFFSLFNFTLSFFYQYYHYKYLTPPDLELLTCGFGVSHPRERHVLIKGREAELVNGGKLSWPNSVGQLSFPSAT
jgi:hypothetical protein